MLLMANVQPASTQTLPRHFVMLQSLFPGKVLLDIDDVAKVLDYGKGHLYNLSSAGKLPFKVSCLGGKRIKVSLIELAAHLDRETLSDYQPPVAPLPRPEVVAKKRRGRPRGSTTRAKAEGIAMAFQSELLKAVYRQEHQVVMDGLAQALDGFESADGLKAAVVAAHAAIARIDLRAAGAQGELPFESRRYPFFVQPSGLVSCLAVHLEDAPLHHGEQDTVVWMPWEQALARVWGVEQERVGWIGRMSFAAPDLAQRVANIRHARLSALR